jgi:1-aminocyclopropane-1-carboxylate deaminase
MTTTSIDQDHPWASFSKGPLQKISTSPGLPDYYVNRLDLLHSWTSGNKYYKLKYVIRQALAEGVTTIVSKGGMFSNHLAALSSTCKSFDIRLIAVIRSYKPDEKNPSIMRLRANGNEIIYLPSSDYNMFDNQEAKKLFPTAMFVPEGGLSALGIRGAAEIPREFMEMKPTHVIIAGGTMSTACGVLSALPASSKLIIVPAWKGCTVEYMEDVIRKYKIEFAGEWELWPDYHFGGFGKFNSELIDFICSYKADFGVPLDPVYTGKLLFALTDKLNRRYFSETDRVVAIHSGGLQGLEGYAYRFPEQWQEC